MMQKLEEGDKVYQVGIWEKVIQAKGTESEQDPYLLQE